MGKLVSVIIPTYGGGDHLARAIDSVLRQTYSDIEVIVVDDNGIGTDNHFKTAAVMSKYESDLRVKYICHETNRNGSAARNTGFRNSEGVYISFLDDDDTFYPQKTTAQVKVLDEAPESVALVYCGCDVYCEEKKTEEKYPSYSNRMLYDLLAHNLTIESSTVMIKRSAFECLNGFDESFRRHQDWEFLARVVANYGVQAVNVIGSRRYLEFRNSARSPEQAKIYREHYLEKMKPYIELLDPNEQKDVYVSNGVDVCMQYLKAKDFKGFLCFYKTKGLGFKGIRLIFRRTINRSFHKGA